MQMEAVGQAVTTPYQGARYNGKEWEQVTGVYPYGFRHYDPTIGRFTGADPIADQFAWVSVFNYAENRPVDGIDLHGLQYVNFNESFYAISMGQTWAKTNSFQAGRDGFGQPYIGTSVPIQMVSVSRPGGKFPLYSGGFARSMQWKAGMLGSSYDATTKTKSYQPNRGYRSTKAYEANSGAMAGFGKAGLVFVMTDLAMTAYKTVKANQDLDAAQAQRGFIVDAWKDVSMAIKGGMIDSQFYNLDDLSSIANFLYQGVDNFGDNEALRATAIDISRNVSGNYKGDGLIIQPNSGLDNYNPSPILNDPPKSKQD